MDIFTILFIAFGLAMDAFAVSVTSGITIKHQRISNALRIALFFGLFQAFMPLVGWLAGLSLKDSISGIDHWIAFGLLGFIGCKMIYESVKIQPKKKINPQNIYILFMLSIATSIDALAVGVTFAFLEVFIATPIIVIGTITFLLSFIGVFIGNKLGHVFEKKIEILGGLVLIAIGIKILLEHMVL
ncbi:MAG: manganese efflux pump MntP family protein [Candidatus Aenigmarchaeota archaeon]|nr:manganese efflux pump MntP family protein [Candidatus Aenigmarchaeota archaeon]